MVHIANVKDLETVPTHCQTLSALLFLQPLSMALRTSSKFFVHV